MSDKLTTKSQVDALVPTSNEEQPEIPPGALPIRTSTGKIVNALRTDPVDEAVKLRTGSTQLDPGVAEVLAQMQGEIRRLSQELDESRVRQTTPDEADSGPGGYPWQYYKRPIIEDPRNSGSLMSGWVTVGPGGAAAGGRRDVGSFAFYSAKGFRPLTDYGVAPIPSDVAGQIGGEFLPILRNGGVREFPVTQILAYKWHIEPPIPGLVFPQYEALRDSVQAYLCDECDLELFFLPEDEQVPQAAFKHLRQTHDYTRQEATLALRGQGILNVAPYAIRAAAATAEAAISADEGLENYPDRKRTVD